MQAVQTEASGVLGYPSSQQSFNEVLSAQDTKIWLLGFDLWNVFRELHPQAASGRVPG